MASKKTTTKSRKKAATKYYPALRSAELTSTNAGTPVQVLQVDQELSKLNHRLYRMMRFYEVKIDVIPQSADSQVEVYVLKNTWAVHKAVQMAYSEYMENVKDERARMTETARWEDFRADHGIPAPFGIARAGLRNELGALTTVPNGEFTLSQVVDGAGTTRTFTFGPGSATTYDMLTQYDASGNQQATPDSVTSQGAYNDLHTGIDDAAADGLKDNGNLPPYSQNTLHANLQWVRVGVLGTNANGAQRLSTGYVTAPAGIVVIRGVESINTLSFEVKAGDYKGVHAPSMLE